jgi:subtilisin family serine protease
VTHVRVARYLVLFGSDRVRAHASMLRHRSGLRVAMSSDFNGTSPFASVPEGEGVLFESLSAAVVRGDPDQIRSLAECTRGRPIRVERERFLVASRADAGPQIRRRSFADTASATWGLQATRSASRYSGRGVRVAILDTGLDLHHPDFRDRPIVARSFLRTEDVDDPNGHGTHCAGILCGPKDPAAVPRYGVASDADLYIAKVLDDEANGSDGDILAGIDWAISNGCAVVSMSLGTAVLAGAAHSEVYEEIARRALGAGSLLIAPAGNSSARPDKIAPVEHPANCPSILSVGAVGPDLELAPFSNANHDGEGGGVDLVGPGIAVRSSVPGPTLYETQNGTSPAVPYVAGVAALFGEAYPTVRGAELRDLLLKQALALPIAARDAGAGLAQAPQ